MTRSSPIGNAAGRRRKALAALMLTVVCTVVLHAPAAGQPSRTPGGVRFTYPSGDERSVVVAGDFNGWSRTDHPLRKENGVWTATIPLRPGLQIYRFIIDDSRFVLDPGNPVTVDNYNRTAQNSAFVLTHDGQVVLAGSAGNTRTNPQDVYPSRPGRQTVFLNIIWHQHQPLYADPATDQLAGPWVRTHATKDYYDMAAMLRGYPDVHCTINLTSSLLHQLRSYYLDRLGPFVDLRKGTMDVTGFLKRWKGKTDPWIDMALQSPAEFTAVEDDHLIRNAWSALGISEVQIARFPAYVSLRDRAHAALGGGPALSVEEKRGILFWFYAAHFDPDFLRGAVKLPGGSTCDLTDLVEERPDGTFHLRRPLTDADNRRMVVEAVKVMAAVIPIHRALMYDPARKTGQVDIITTPYYHPILPLIYDSELARTCQPADAHPARFSEPGDARAQVVKAVRMYRSIFGAAPAGMWPGEGSVAQPVLAILREQGIQWTASDVRVLRASRPAGQPNTTPYRFPAGDRGIALVFRDTELSDRIGFTYQTMDPEEAAEDFVSSVLAMAPEEGKPPVLVTVILDGENAWEWYQKDNDGKKFLHALYRKLTALHAARQVVTVTMSEYLRGNPARGVVPHPVEQLPRMEWLWPGSWINGNYDTWIGEPEENLAWEYLRTARADLAASGIARPDPRSDPPRAGTRAWYAYMAWEEMYAAEGSDWFWWYGADQTAPAGDAPFDRAYRAHLENVYTFGRRAGGTFPERTFPPILGTTADGRPATEGAQTGTGAMARSSGTGQEVLFVCDASAVRVPTGIFIAGDRDVLGMWAPNTVPMRDDGLEGDEKAGDGFWSLKVRIPAGTQVSYKYTNSGSPGKWIPGEEFAQRNRTVTVQGSTTLFIIRDTFGQ